jgi:hypothetical protein
MSARAATTATYVKVSAQASDYWSGPSYTGTSLQTYGSSAVGNLPLISSIPAANSGSLLFETTTNAIVYTNNFTPLIFGTSGIERARITAAGNVGIGTASPAVPLDVVGQIRSTDGTVDVRFLPTNASNAASIGTFSASDVVLTAGSGGTARVRILASNGNVGIGTATPGSPLDVVGNINASYISTSSSTSTTPTLSFNASNTSVAKGATVSGSYVQDVNQNKSATAGASANYVVSPDNGTDSTYYGEFGINSSVFSSGTPGDFFSLNNQIYFSGHDGDIAIGSGNGYKTYFPWGATAASAHVINASGALGFSTNLGTTLANSGTIGFGISGAIAVSQGSAAAPVWSSSLYVASSGNIGIGSTSPEFKLKIVANTNGSDGLFITNTSTGGASQTFLQIQAQSWNGVQFLQSRATGNCIFYTSDNVPYIFTNNSSEKMRIAPSGNVGIGTSSPAYPLDVNGTINATASILGGVSQSPYTAAPLFGTGADGAVTISSGTTTLARDMNYTNLTINGSGLIVTNGFRIFVSGTLDISAAPAGAISGGNNLTAGTITNGMTGRNAVAGTTGAGGAGLVSITIMSGVYQMGGDAKASGNGGTAVAGTIAGGTGDPGLVAPNRVNWNLSTPNINLNIWNAAATWPIGGASVTKIGGGGAGAGDGTNLGGSGGSGPYTSAAIGIFARFIQRGSNLTAGIITAVGAAFGSSGGNAAGGNAGGGGGSSGAPGGFIYIIAEQLLGSTITNAIDVSGLAGGTGGNGAGTGKGGNGGSGGNGGNYQIVVLNPASYTVSSFNAAGTAGSTTSTSTGAAGGAGATVRGNL